MKELDDRIREALRRENAALADEFAGEPSLFEMVAETFQGRHRWLVAMTMFWTLVFFVGAVVAGAKFFWAAEMREMMLWAGACLFCVLAVSMMKSWYWMELNKNAVLREVKRVELQIARLAERGKN